MHRMNLATVNKRRATSEAAKRLTKIAKAGNQEVNHQKEEELIMSLGLCLLKTTK